MKRNTILIITTALLCSYSLYQAMESQSKLSVEDFTKSDVEMFQKFKQTYKKVYSSPEESLFRLQTLIKAKKFINKFNSLGRSVTLKLTSVADMTQEEFKAITKKGITFNIQKTAQAEQAPPKGLEGEFNGGELVDWSSKLPKVQST